VARLWHGRRARRLFAGGGGGSRLVRRVRPVLGNPALWARALRARGSRGRSGRLGLWPPPGGRPGRMVEVRSGYVDRPVSAGFGCWVTFGGPTSRSHRGGRWPGLNAAGLHPSLPCVWAARSQGVISSLLAGGLGAVGGLRLRQQRSGCRRSTDVDGSRCCDWKRQTTQGRSGQGPREAPCIG
jgi:hypothetical protein